MQTTPEKIESILGVKKNPSQREKELFRKTQDFVQYIKWIPGLRMVAVSNSLAMYATHEDSDIDLFIITQAKRLWIVRTTVLIIATFLGVRAKPGNEAGKFCFPFFITEKKLPLKEVAIENDVYLAYWIASLKPVYNKYYTYGRFMEVNQSFCETVLNITLSEEEIKKNKEFLVIMPRYENIKKIWTVLSPLLTLKNNIL